MNTLEDLHAKLSADVFGAEFNDVRREITVPGRGITIYKSNDTDLFNVILAYSRYIYRLYEGDCEGAYSITCAYLNGSLDVTPIDDKTIAVDGRSSGKPPRMPSPLFRVFDIFIGIMLLFFSSVFTLAGLADLNGAGKSTLSEASPSALGIAAMVISVSLIHHGIAKDPIRPMKAFMYGLGVFLFGFVGTLLMITFDGTTAENFSDRTGNCIIYAIIAIIAFFLVRYGLKISADEGVDIHYVCRRIPKLPTERDLESLVRKVFNDTIMPNIEVSSVKDDTVSITDSKVGGLPYWERGMELPVDRRGEKMVFFAQVNCARVVWNNSLPREGLLQFFISKDIDSCAVVYHRTTYAQPDEAELRALDIPASVKDGADVTEFALRFTESRSELSIYDDDANYFLHQTADELGIILDDDLELADIAEDKFEDPEYCEYSTCLLGRPAIMSRQPSPRPERYDTLLLTVDTMDDSAFFAIFGSYGRAHIFINSADLKAHNFRDTYLIWEKY